MSEPGLDHAQPGVLHGTAAPLDDALRAELYAAIEAIYAVGISDTSLHRDALKPDTGRHPVVTNHDVDHVPFYLAPNAPVEAACGRLTECLKFWQSKIQIRSLHRQSAIYHLHPPSNAQYFESRVTGKHMSAADSALVARLRGLCPKLGFEVLPVVMEYTGTTCQYNAWVPLQQSNGHAGPDQNGQNGSWKPYQHVKHSPRVHQFRSLTGITLAEISDCHEGNVLDERNVAWERARRGIFFWQGSHEEQLFEEERRVRETNPKWYQNIIPGTSADLGQYFAPAIMIVPLSTQLEFINRVEQPQPAINIWRYLLRQCEGSPEPAAYFTALKALCHFVWHDPDEAPGSSCILGMQVQNRQQWIDAVDAALMGDLILTSLVFKDHQLCNHLSTHTQVEPKIDYARLCLNASIYSYSAADVLYGLRRFLFHCNNFLQISSNINKLPAHSEISPVTQSTLELVNTALATHLNPPVSASHGRTVVDFLKFFKEFKTWSVMVTSVITSKPHELHKHGQFMLGLLNRLLEVAKRDGLPLDQVKAFYRKYEELMSTSHTLWQISRLVSNTTKHHSAEAQAARQTWCVAEPTEGLPRDKSEPLPTSYAVIAGLFRNLGRLGMHKEVAKLADHIVQHQAEIEPIHMAPLWLPCLRILHGLVEPDTQAYQRLFQAIFECYEKAVFEDVSGRLEQDPESIPPMAPCCNHCKTLNSYFEQPLWRTLHLVKPKAVVDHIQSQLREQGKPIKTHVYGKNDLSLTMQLTKASLVNERLLEVGQLRRKEATNAVRQFDPGMLLQFLGDKGDIMWRLGNAEAQESPTTLTPGKASGAPSTSTAGPSRTSSSSTTSSAPSSSATPRKDLLDPLAERESLSSIDSTQDETTPTIEGRSRPGIVKTDPSPVSGSVKRPNQEYKDIRGMFSTSGEKEKSTPTTGSQGPVNSGTSTRDRLKKLGTLRRESTPKLADASRNRLQTTPGGSRTTTGTSGSNVVEAQELSGRRDPLQSFGGVRSRGVVFRKAGASRPRETAALPSRTSGDLDTSRSNAASSTSPAHGSAGPDFMSAVLEAERARKRRPAGSAWEVRTESGGVVASGTSSPAARKSRFDGLARDKENPRPSGLAMTGSRPRLGASQAGGSAAAAGVLAARSPNVRSEPRISSASAGAKRKVDGDDAVIDLCNSSPESGPSKRRKDVPVFDPLDDDPFAD